MYGYLNPLYWDSAKGRAIDFYAPLAGINGAQAGGVDYYGGTAPAGGVYRWDKIKVTRRDREIRAPSTTILLSEVLNGNFYFETGNDFYNRLYRTVHNGGSNYLFFDGHVEWIKSAGIRRGLYTLDPAD